LKPIKNTKKNERSDFDFIEFVLKKVFLRSLFSNYLKSKDQ
jgi:hypothetical protein